MPRRADGALGPILITVGPFVMTGLLSALLTAVAS